MPEVALTTTHEEILQEGTVGDTGTTTGDIEISLDPSTNPFVPSGVLISGDALLANADLMKVLGLSRYVDPLESALGFSRSESSQDSLWATDGPNSLWATDGPNSLWATDGPNSLWATDGPKDILVDMDNNTSSTGSYVQGDLDSIVLDGTGQLPEADPEDIFCDGDMCYDPCIDNLESALGFSSHDII